MMLDDQTFKDLEIFESGMEGGSLFDLCNFTRNRGGAAALKQRMRQPWSDPARIRAVQDAVSFIMANREVFEPLPNFIITDSVDRYLFGSLPLITSSNMVEFFIEGMQFRYGDSTRFSRLEHGVDCTCIMIRALREILVAPAMAEAPGELAQLVEEMRDLLYRDSFKCVPEDPDKNLNAWAMLRTDQIFRIHQKSTIDRLLALLYELDVLVSMAEATRQHGFVMPGIEDGPLSLHAEGLVHPFVAGGIANPVSLDQPRRMLFLTGPNMAGKTTYLRSCAIALYLAHLGMGVPARSFRFVPAERLFSSITLADNIHGGVSFFRAEALRVKAIAQAVSEGHRVIALMDEPFKGTNVKDAFDASQAILERFAHKENCLFMFSSHLIELCDDMDGLAQVDCRHFKADEEEESLRFDYVLRPGISTQRLGMRVLREEGIFDLLDA